MLAICPVCNFCPSDTQRIIISLNNMPLIIFFVKIDTGAPSLTANQELNSASSVYDFFPSLSVILFIKATVKVCSCGTATTCVSLCYSNSSVKSPVK